MDISVQELSNVDKEIKISASREDLAPNFEKAYKKVQGQVQMPGFRPGKTPLGLIKKRYGKEIELDEINSYVQEVYEKQIVPDYEPIGETEMTDMKWEDDQLEVVFKVGVKPEFELAEIEKIKIDKMVHDVTDEEVKEEVERSLERQGNWEEVKTGVITEDHRVTVDAVTLDEEGNPVEGETDEDQKLDLRQEGAKEFKETLLGKKVGDVVKMGLGEESGEDRFELHVKKIEKMAKAELNDEFVKQQSGGEAKNVDEFNSYIKSKMQEYYDQSSNDMFRQDAIDALTDAHNIAVPEVLKKQVLNSYVEYAKQQSGGELPAGFNADEYKEKMGVQAEREAKWAFISQKLQEKFEDIEIKPEDIEEYIGVEAARYGATAEQLKSYYAQNPSLLENMRTSIRENKVFDKLAEVVKINELSKEDYRLKREEKNKKAEKEEAQDQKK